MKMQKTNKNSAAMKLGLAAVASLALTFGAAMPAFAANMQVGPGDVAPYEAEDGSNYPGWHIGSTDNPDAKLADSLTFGECSVTTAGLDGGHWVQVLNGFTEAERPSASDGSIAELEALMNSASITVLTGTVTIQVPIFIFPDGDLNNPDPVFTTIRSSLLEPGTYNLADLILTDSGGSSEFPPAVLLEILGSFIEEGPAVIQVLGVGFNGNEGATVSTLSFNGDTYFFGDGNCLPAVATPPTKIETAA